MRTGNIAAALGSAAVVNLALMWSAAPPAQAQAVDIAQLPAMSEALQAKRAQAGAAASEVAAAEADLAPKNKEMTLWNGEIQKLVPLYTNLNARIEAHNKDAERQRAAVARHTAECPAVVPTQAQADRCNGEIAPLRQWQKRIDDAKTSLDRETHGLDTRRNNIVTRQKQLQGEMAPIVERYRRAAADLEAAQREVKRLEEWIMAARRYCEGKVRKGPGDVGEADHYCFSMQWDNAIPGLPPLENPKPPFSVKPN